MLQDEFCRGELDGAPGGNAGDAHRRAAEEGGHPLGAVHFGHTVDDIGIPPRLAALAIVGHARLDDVGWGVEHTDGDVGHPASDGVVHRSQLAAAPPGEDVFNGKVAGKFD